MDGDLFRQRLAGIADNTIASFVEAAHERLTEEDPVTGAGLREEGRGTVPSVAVEPGRLLGSADRR